MTPAFHPELTYRLNLGSGSACLPDHVNMDVLELEGVDVVHDMTSFPWPFPDGAFVSVFASHVLEHVPQENDGKGLLRVMEEIYRVLRPGGTLHVKAPHPDDAESVWSDPTHTRMISARTFDHFTGKRLAYGVRANFRLVEVRDSNWKSRYPGVPVLWRLRRAVEAEYVLVKVA